VKVAITDCTFQPIDVEKAILEPLGCNVIGMQCRTTEELVALTRDADCVITQFARVNAEVIGAMQKCRVIVRYGIGVDNVDLNAAAAKSIPVCNVPDYCIDEVADHTLALMLALTRGVVPTWDEIRRGNWRLGVPLGSMHALRDVTIGLIAFGRIGREVARRLLAFKSKVLAYDPALDADTIREAGCEPVDLEAIWARSDLISLHCPSTEKTRFLINATSIQKMKRGAILVNCSRGDLVQTEDLVAALRNGQIGGAALDVTWPEPIPKDSPLLSMPNVVITAHVASASPPAVAKLRTTAAQIAAAALRGERLPNVVNGVGVQEGIHVEHL
jgi:D-3-phosphoglycerate dehydrogenase